MANLIITIISIALVAVAALMGAYYGGQAFQDAQANARANELLSHASQILAAYSLYMVDNSISHFTYANANGIQDSKYLTGSRFPFFRITQFPWFCSSIGCNPGANSVQIYGGSFNYIELYPIYLTSGTSQGGGPALRFYIAGPISSDSASVANDPLIRMCVALNRRKSEVFQTGFTYQASGLPRRNAPFPSAALKAWYIGGNGPPATPNDLNIENVNTCETYRWNPSYIEILLQP